MMMILKPYGDIHYATHLLSFLIGTFLPGSSGVMRHVRGLYEKYEVDKGLKSLHGLGISDLCHLTSSSWVMANLPLERDGSKILKNMLSLML